MVIDMMSLNLVDLNTSNVRSLMLQEFDADVKGGTVYRSPRLKPTAHQIYFVLMRYAIDAGDSATLARSIQVGAYLQSTYQRRKPKGGYSTVKMPSNAHTTLAEGEFNRFYLRGLCLEAIQQRNMIEVYRAKAVRQPRSASQALIGTQFNPTQLLTDLRTHIGVDTALGLPSGPNSGLSGKMV